MKYSFTFIIMLCILNSHAQLTPMFETTIYFEDAIGNKDSIIYGYDTLANATYNPNFGEITLETPYDSIFEVRATHNVLDLFHSSDVRTKKIVAHTYNLGGTWICNLAGAGIGIEVYIKHQPLKIYWNSEDFYDICRINGYVTATVLGTLPTDIFENQDIDHGCLWNQDTSYFYLEPWPEGLQGYYREGNIEGGVLDTLYGLEFSPVPMQGWSPCWNWIVSDEEVLLQPSVSSLFPNPSTQQVTLQSTNNVEKTAIIYNVNGQKIKQFTFSDNIEIITAHWAQGLYFVQLQNKEGRLLEVLKLLKQ